MNVRYTLHDIGFEWDSDKATANLRKHNVAFEIACEVFFDPFFRVEDAGVVEGKQREAVIGLTVNWRVLFVVYVAQESDVMRIISARPATGTERKMYEDQ